MKFHKLLFLGRLTLVGSIAFSIFLFSTTICLAQTANQQQADGHVQLTQLQNDTDNLTYTWDTTLDTPRFLRFGHLNINWQSDDDVKRSWLCIGSSIF